MKLTWNPWNWFLLAISWMKSAKAKEEVQQGAKLGQKYLPLVTAFLRTGYVPQKVSAVMQTYGIPIINGLADGSITVESEIKTLIGNAVADVIKRNEGVSTTAAEIARNVALSEAWHSDNESSA